MSERPRPTQLSFLAPDDVEMLVMMRRFMAEASRLYETRSGRELAEPVLITQPQDVFELFRPEMSQLEQEQLHTLSVDVRHQVIASHLLYQGTTSGTLVADGHRHWIGHEGHAA